MRPQRSSLGVQVFGGFLAWGLGSISVLTEEPFQSLPLHIAEEAGLANSWEVHYTSHPVAELRQLASAAAVEETVQLEEVFDLRPLVQRDVIAVVERVGRATFYFLGEEQLKGDESTEGD